MGDAPLGEYTGFHEQLDNPVRHRELPSGKVVLLFGFGDPVRIEHARYSTGVVAALRERTAWTGHHGTQHGIAVCLDPLRAHAVFGMPMHLLSNRLVDSTAVLGPAGPRLTEQLAETPDWATRFTLLDAALARLAAAGPVPDPAIAWAWRRLKSVPGTRISLLAAELGWSTRTLERKFNHQIGLPPKTAARVLRFDRAVRLLTARADMATVAAAAGYSDQSHFAREVRAFADCPPSLLAADRARIADIETGYVDR
ncbi:MULTISPECIES: helix-turn-helix domain-containing protein [unclassified Nocardia]|uniref:AraC family transcriptional regulator n=1 Tax=unclassified Nocardia TaxID=2637762 RepID=UPI001CE3DD3E|nr:MULTISPECIES: helix-turn-helix domain-containing protein [unclassified Nocardia]